MVAYYLPDSQRVITVVDEPVTTEYPYVEIEEVPKPQHRDNYLAIPFIVNNEITYKYLSKNEEHKDNLKIKIAAKKIRSK